MKNIFYNSDDSRLRALWRIIITTILLLSLVSVWSFFFYTHLYVTIGLAFIVPVTMWFASTFIDKRPFGVYGLFLNTLWLRDFLAGNIMAAGVMCSLLTVFVILDYAQITAVNIAPLKFSVLLPFLQMLVFMFAVSLWEEAYFRGYLITNLKEGLKIGPVDSKMSIILAVLLSALIFGAAHTGNPNVTAFAVINIIFAGIIFAYPYIKSKSLGISVGMHLSWNYFQGVVFGMPVSGMKLSESFAKTTFTGPDLITGGQFGPEGGAAGFAGLVLLAAICHLYLVLFYKK